MDIWKFAGENENLIIVSAIGLVIVGLVVLISANRRIRKNRERKIQNERLLRSVTSLERGTTSERHLVLELLKHGIPAETIFHDLYIEKRNGSFTQIDIVIATSEGIIVLEVKDYSGWIFGNGSHSNWTQVLAYGKKKYRFYNPIKQNSNHIEALRNQTRQFQSIPFFSIIVFYGDCELKDINFIPEGTFIVKFHRIFDVIELIKNNNSNAPYNNKREIVEILKQAVLKGDSLAIKENHVDNINDMLGKHRIFD